MTNYRSPRTTERGSSFIHTILVLFILSGAGFIGITYAMRNGVEIFSSVWRDKIAVLRKEAKLITASKTYQQKVEVSKPANWPIIGIVGQSTVTATIPVTVTAGIEFSSLSGELSSDGKVLTLKVARPVIFSIGNEGSVAISKETRDWFGPGEVGADLTSNAIELAKRDAKVDVCQQGSDILRLARSEAESLLREKFSNTDKRITQVTVVFTEPTDRGSCAWKS